MDPKKIYEMILDGREIDSSFDVSEIIDEFTTIDKAMKELENAVRDFEDQPGFSNDFTSINRKLDAKKMALEFESVDAAYEM